MLHEKAMLVKLNISQWSGRIKDKKITKETNAFYGAAENSGHYSKIIISKSAIKPIQQAVNEARKFHYENTLPWGDNGERLLPSKNYLDYTRQLREHNALFDTQVKNFLEVYPELIVDAEYKLNKMFNPADYPDVYQLRQRFSFTTEINPVPSGEDFRVNLAQAEQEDIRKQIEHQTRRAQARAMEDLWNRLYDVVSKMADRLSESDAVFRDSLVGNVQSLVQLLPKLNVTEDPDLEKLTREVERRLCRYTPADLRKNEAAKTEAYHDASAIVEFMGAYMGNSKTREAAA